MEEEQKSNKFIVPGAIIIAGLIIAGAVVYNKKAPTADIGESQQAAVGQNKPSANEPTPSEPVIAGNISPVTANDHFLGNPDAAVTVILYTDMVCPFCKRFHATMKQVMDEYGKTGKLKWIVRHFPLESIHPKAKGEAVAAECAADQGGSEKFFAFLDRVFETSPAEGFDNPDLIKIAEYVGLNKTNFETCLNSGKFDQKIKDTVDVAMQAGVLGTPYSAVLGPNGKNSDIPGALPYSDVKKVIDEMLK